MVALRRRQRSSVSAPVEEQRDPTSVPGKPFLEHLHRVLDTSGDESNESAAGANGGLRAFQSSSRRLLARHQERGLARPLAVDASCLCYLQQLFHAMLTPTTSPHSGLITQWRLDASFAEQLDENPEAASTMSAASPQKILQLAGRLLEVDTLRITNTASEPTLPMPSNCDLAMLPKITRLHLDHVNLHTISGLACVSETLTSSLVFMKELRFSNKPIISLAALLATDDPPAKWRSLRSLCVDNAQLARVDAADVVRMPNLETIVLQNNALETLGALIQCHWLSTIDVSHNRIRSLDLAVGCMEHLKVLNLAYNQIQSSSPLRHCLHLERLDLRHNLVHDFEEIQALASLSSLHTLLLKGNPISKLAKYRRTVRSLLSSEVLLDSQPWEIMDLEDFALGRNSSLDGQKHSPTSDVDGVSQAISDGESPQVDKWWVARGIGSACLVIGFAQLIVSTVWSRDTQAEQLTLSIVGATAALSVVALLSTLAISWLGDWWNQQLKRSRKQNHEDENPATERSAIQPLTGGVVSTLNTIDDEPRHFNYESFLSLDDFSTALEDASHAGDDVTVDQLLSVCCHLRECVAYWSRHESTGFGFLWRRLDRALSTFKMPALSASPAEMLCERLGSRITLALDATQPSQSSATALAKLVPVIRLCAIVFASLSAGGSLTQCLRDAYVEVFASRHTWWRQRAVLASMRDSPTTDEFFEWIHSTHASRDHHRLLAIVRMCGPRLHLLHVCLRDLVDEHEQSFSLPH